MGVAVAGSIQTSAQTVVGQSSRLLTGVVGSANLPPVWGSAAGAAFNLKPGESLNMAHALRFSDPNNDSLDITKVSGNLPAGVSYDPTTGNITASASATLGLSGDLVFQADDGPASPPPQQQLTPVLWGSDITSGPNTGNGDTTFGQVANVNGCYVSVWGVNLGTTRGTSTITCNGAAVTVIPYWGPAVPPWSPANFVNGWVNWQMIIFQVPSTAASGLGQIVVTVGGVVSKTVVTTYDHTTGFTRVLQDGLPFTVRPGRILFASLTGNDTSGNGSWATPYLTLTKLRGVLLTPGDIGYVCNGITAGGLSIDRTWDGTEAAPIALIAYPGAVVTIGALTTQGIIAHIRAQWRVLAKFRIYGGGNSTIQCLTNTYSLASVGDLDGIRVVGNDVQAPEGDAADGTVALSCGNFRRLLFNEIHNVSTTTGYNSLYHTVYSSGVREVTTRPPDEIDHEFAYNYIHDNRSDGGMQLFNVANTSTNLPARVCGYNIHHNMIIDQWGAGINFSGHGDFNDCHNNIIIRVGRGAIAIRNGVASHRIFNNTLIDNGWMNQYPGERGTFHWGSGSAWTSTQVIKNNICIQKHVDQPYVSTNSGGEDPNLIASNNVWFGRPTPPSFVGDTNPVTVEPSFVSFTATPIVPTGTSIPKPSVPWNLHAVAGSSVINAGTDTSVVVTFDMDGKMCPQNGVFDVGAYEL